MLTHFNFSRSDFNTDSEQGYLPTFSVLINQFHVKPSICTSPGRGIEGSEKEYRNSFFVAFPRKMRANQQLGRHPHDDSKHETHENASSEYSVCPVNDLSRN
ncbi:hypothetical protein Mapa_010035 [Marchantia paleacea]|nr:hypothetical protein Mapa_010035 [Marchantia paleacea]